MLDMTQTHVAHTLKHNSPLISCRFDPSGRYVFAGAQDYKVWRFEIESGTKAEFPVDAWVRGLAFDASKEMVIIGGYDGRLSWWPVAADEPKPVRSIEAHHGWIRALAVSPDGAMLATVGNDLLVKLWDLSDGKLIRELSGHESHIYNAAFHPAGGHLVTGDLKGNLIDWDLATGTQARTWQADSLAKYDTTFRADIGGFRSMAFNPDGTRLAGGGITKVTNAFAGVGNPSVVVFDWAKGEQVVEHLSKGPLEGYIWGVALHASGVTVGAMGGRGGGYLLFWNEKDTEDFHRLKLPDTARDMDLASDGLRVATAHHDGQVRVSSMTAKA